MVEVETEAGRVRGVRDGRTWCWRGVPYAAAPAGGLRFRPPNPPVRWSGVREASHFGAAAPQHFRRFGGGRGRHAAGFAEDCLDLNIWSPASDDRPRPVLVWVHGGAFLEGSGALYQGAPLAAGGDIVVVTLNYRLGALGFVDFGPALGDPAVGRNLGLQDVTAALGWIERNIGGFGGDPGRVTLAGESAGALVASLLMLTPAARLFRQVILQSPAFDLIQAPAKAARVARLFLDHLDPRPRNLADLQAIAPDMLLAVQAEVARALKGESPAGPVFDADLLPVSSAEAAAAAVLPMPLLAGTTRSASDAATVAPLLRFAERHAAHGAPTWLYRFDYAHSLLGARQGLDLMFLWPFPGAAAALRRGGFLTGLRSGLSERMRAAWTSFVRNGTPGDDWPAYRAPERPTRLFALQDRIVPDPMQARRKA